MATVHDIIVDCARPSAVARFWAEALDGYRVAPYDQDELDRLRAMGVRDIADDPSVLVEPVARPGPRFFFQLVTEPKQVKNRLHLDLVAEDVTPEIDRLVAAGAHIVAEHRGHVVLADVENNEFCLMRVRPGAESAPAEPVGDRL